MTLALGDCFDILPTLADKSVSLVLADLPYGTTQNKWDSVLDLQRLWAEYDRVCTGAVILFSQGVFTAQVIASNVSAFRYKLVWEKSKPTNFLNVSRQPLRKHEDICVFYRSQPTYNPQKSEGKPYSKGVRKDQLTGSYGDFAPVLVASEGGRHPTDIIYHKTAESEGPVVHPTQKPVGLLEYLIKTYTNPGDIVLDNAMGSGSTCVAASRTGRRFIGIEKDPGFFAIAEQRLTAESEAA
ncbi:site-specific DNA-methyltransferase [Pseudorhizobium endolithicum]|uniref:Methyltransferase n=1 Tax=Pseudorhizobium endolithicum TaxID=1191678 RepID=A0ABM8PCV6_9HYPH|nr:site-specific DNA-methyltransferase [Pseudorhizobium endolithicum]CAD7023316.1 site-specific DNA-methyltransferase [Pseudorhizobium endolithicum]